VSRVRFPVPYPVIQPPETAKRLRTRDTRVSDGTRAGEQRF
jgi:hypothetical protein